MVTPQPTKEETLAKMAEDALKAKDEYLEMTSKMSEQELGVLEDIRSWWKNWFGRAGHKRLAYILMGK